MQSDLVEGYGPANQTSQAPASQGTEPAKEKDTFERVGDGFSSLSHTVRGWFGKAEEKKSDRPAWGPDNLPPKPKFPSPEPGEGPEVRERNRQTLLKFGREYRDYCAAFKEVYANCKSIEQLRNCDPAEVGKALQQGLPDLAAYMQSARSELYDLKVKRGYELLGESPPGTLMVTLKLALKAGDVEIEGSASADTAGKSSSGVAVSAQNAKAGIKDGKGFISTNAAAEHRGTGAAISQDEEGRWQGGGKVAGVGVSVDSDGMVKVGVGMGGMGASANYNPSTAEYGMSIGGSRKVELAGAEIEATAEGELRFKGISKEDVMRALQGWMVKPNSEDIAD